MERLTWFVRRLDRLLRGSLRLVRTLAAIAIAVQVLVVVTRHLWD